MVIPSGDEQFRSAQSKELKRPRIVVVTGAESTGKSVLTRQLGDYYSCPWYPEYAREYLENREGHYTRQDVLHIARFQKKQMNDAQLNKSDFVFFDTWLIITKVWLEVAYGNAPFWISETIAAAPVDLFLFCDTDIPWESDPLRENGGEMRDRLSSVYKSNLLHFGFDYHIVSGKGEERFLNAVQIISKTL